MANNILINASSVGSYRVKSIADDLNNAKNQLDRLNQYGALASATYCGPDGRTALFPIDYADRAADAGIKLAAILNKLEQYRQLLDAAPEEFADIDDSYKNQLTEWWERIDYSKVARGAIALSGPVGLAYTLMTSDKVQSFAASIVNFYVEDYKNNGLTYKIVKSVDAIGDAVPAVLSCAATWGATILSGGAGLPIALLSTIYTVNEGVSCLVDLTNIWVTEDYDEVGEYNLLRDTLVENAGELGEMLGNKEAGEIVGEIVYDVGDIVDTVADVGKLTGVKTKKTLAGLDGKITQSDVDFDTFKKAVEQSPEGLYGFFDILTGTPITDIHFSEIKKDLKLLSYQVPDIKKVAGVKDLLEDVSSKTQKIMNYGIKYIERLHGI